MFCCFRSSVKSPQSHQLPQLSKAPTQLVKLRLPNSSTSVPAFRSSSSWPDSSDGSLTPRGRELLEALTKDLNGDSSLSE